MFPIIFFSCILIALYIWLIIWLNKGWTNIRIYSDSATGNTTVTVIIPFRNEEDHIPSLLKALKSQTYPAACWKVVFVDDHSTDTSCSLIQSGIPDAGLIFLPQGVFGKKQALEYGAKNAMGDLLLFTDADCIPKRTWISSVVSCFESLQPVLISAPVIMDAGKSFLSKFQAIEFLSLTGSGAAAFGNNDPVMVNGANLAIRRDIYLENLKVKQIPTTSGDDIFLLLNLKKKYAGRLVFLKSQDAIVRTSAMPDIKSFVQQRLRWTSKSRHYRDSTVIKISLLVFLVNIWLLICFITGFFTMEFLIIWGVMFILKSIFDYVFLKKVATFTGQLSLIRMFVLSELVYFLYIGFTGIAGNLITVKWKERDIQT